MNISLKIDTYLKNLALPHDSSLAKEIFLFLDNEIQTDIVTGNEEKIAKLFCRTIETFNQDEKLEEDVQQAIIDAFDNIRTIENNTHENGELMCIYLLNLLFNNRDDFEQVPENDFVLLLDNLEKIRVIFKITDSNNNIVFPIGNFLFKLINSENLFYEIENVSSIQALMLALQIFDSAQYPQQLKDIKEMIKGKDLRFIEYLYHKCTRIGDEDWKENYEKNGLLVLYDAIDGKVLVRNKNETYFKTNYDISEYGCGNVIYEKNANRDPIAYFVEYSLNDFKAVDLKKEFANENNADRISQILDIIYYYKNYNVISESALFEKKGRIYPINPFGANDSYVVYQGSSNKDGKHLVSEKLHKYGLLQISGNGLSYINLGIFTRLDEIYAIQFAEFGLKSDSSISDIIGNWLAHCSDKQKCFDEFLKDYEEQVKYIYSSNSIFEKKYGGEYLIPSCISEQIMDSLQLDNKFLLFAPEKCNVFIDRIQDEIQIKNSKGEALIDYEIEDIVGEDINVSDGEIIALVDDATGKVYVGNQVDYYYRMLNKINQINSSLLSDNILNKVNENDICDIARKMECFNDALSDLHPGLPIESIARYRLLNHLLLLRPNETEIRSWLDLIKRHQIVDYSVVKGNSLLNGSEGVLFVPKDRPRAQSTLKYINEKYFNSPLRRNAIDIYDQKIVEQNGCFYAENKKIERVVLMFDNIQNGKSTKETIDYYINNQVNVEGDTHMTFLCNGKEISVHDILDANKCKIEIYSIYAGDIGLDEVKNHVAKNYPTMRITVLDPVKKLTAEVNKQDIDVMNRFYLGIIINKFTDMQPGFSTETA